MQTWQIATLIKSELAADNLKALTFSVEGWQAHQPGQHYDIRLTAPNGYQTKRSYSIASPPEQTGEIEFGIQLLESGEVSPYLWSLEPGGKIEIRGPIGGHFIWNTGMPGPLVVIGGGSGMTPLMAMLRHSDKRPSFAKALEGKQATSDKITSPNLSLERRGRDAREVVVVVSARTLAHIPYRAEIENVAKESSNVTLAYAITDEPGVTNPGIKYFYERRVDETILREVAMQLLGKMPMIYVCGPTPFVEAVAEGLTKIGFNPHEIRTERFG